MCSFLSELLSCLTIKKIASILNGLEELENHRHNLDYPLKITIIWDDPNPISQILRELFPSRTHYWTIIYSSEGKAKTYQELWYSDAKKSQNRSHRVKIRSFVLRKISRSDLPTTATIWVPQAMFPKSSFWRYFQKTTSLNTLFMYQKSNFSKDRSTSCLFIIGRL